METRTTAWMDPQAEAHPPVTARGLEQPVTGFLLEDQAVSRQFQLTCCEPSSMVWMKVQERQTRAVLGRVDGAGCCPGGVG